MRDIPGSEGKSREYLVPHALTIDSQQYSAIDAVPKVHVPILFIAGEKDIVIPKEEVDEIYQKANEPKDFLLMPHIGHDYRHNVEEIAVGNDEIIRWLKVKNAIPA